MRSYLVADIGGTHARCAQAVVDETGSGFVLRHVRQYACSDHATIDAMFERYRDETGPLPHHGCVAVAGPVGGDRVTLTNNDWNFSTRQLQKRFGLTRLSVINDLEAIAYASVQAPAQDLVTLRAGRSRRGDTRVAISPGTGLGIAGVVVIEGKATALPSEAGHTAFAPVNAQQRALHDAVAKDVDFVSWETVLSGPGLVTLHRALAGLNGVHGCDLEPEDITRRAIEGRDPDCQRSIEAFIDILANFASHSALTFCATGGVYLAGNICRGLRPWLTNGRFAEAFRAQGVMTGYLEDLPIHFLALDYPGLTGAACHAHRTRHAQTAPVRADVAS